MYFFNAETSIQKLLVFIFVAWTIAWKGWALWKAARNNHRYWFIGLLIVNLFGIPEILYIFFFSKQKNKTIRKRTPHKDYLAHNK